MSLSFSVAMCTYNGARFLEEQLESLRAQDHLPFELVVSDDGSSDATIEVVQRFAARAPFVVRVLEQGPRLGPTKNFERAVTACRADLIAFCDQDDIWEKRKLAALAQVFESSPRVGACFCDALLVDENGRSLGETLWGRIGFDKEARQQFAAGHVSDALIRRTIAFGLVMAFRSDLRRYTVPFAMPWGHDNWSALVIAALREVALVDAPLLRYRQHEKQVSSAGSGKWLSRLARKGPASPNGIVPNAASFQQLASRLGAHRADASDAARFATIEQHVVRKASHLRFREELPSSPLRRSRCVAAELLSGRYSLYSNGLGSAARDLLHR